jgi:hypothetical protein
MYKYITKNLQIMTDDSHAKSINLSQKKRVAFNKATRFLTMKKNYIAATFAAVFLSRAMPSLSPNFASANSDP